MSDDAEMDAASELFQSAAFGLTPWDEALNRFAETLDTRSGQLIGIGGSATVPFNVMTKMAPNAAAEFFSAGGGDPSVNSRVSVGRISAEMQFRDETHFTTRDDRLRTPEFGAWLDRHEIGYTCIMNLILRPNLIIGIAALRGCRQPAMVDREKRRFSQLARHVRSAVTMQLAIEDQGSRLVTDAMEQVDAAVLVCDAHGKVRNCSLQAAVELSRGRWLRSQNDFVRFNTESDSKKFFRALGTAIATIGNASVSPAPAFTISDQDGLPLTIEIAPLPRQHELNFNPAAVVVLHVARAREDRRAQLGSRMFRLTKAETNVLRDLLAGNSVNEIAAALGVGVGTVRTHVHRLLAKSGCTSQRELVAMLGQYF